MKNMGKTLLSLLLAAIMLCQTACSGGETAVTDGENTPVFVIRVTEREHGDKRAETGRKA